MDSRFIDSADGTKLRLVIHGDGDRDVLIVGGLAEHAGRYPHVAAAFSGHRVTILELRGHGHSGGRRGYVTTWEDYVNDVKAAVATLRPGFLFIAHSMGGLVALESLRLGVTPAKLALSNPLLGVAVKVPGWKVAVGNALSGLWPTLALTNEINPDELSRDLEIGRAYTADKLVFNKVTARWFTEMKAAQERANGYTPSTPVGMFLGAADHITDIAVSRAWAKRVGAPVREWPEMRHEIFNEIGKAEVIEAVRSWLLS